MGSGVTESTWQNLIIDSGVVYANYGLGESEGERILGATNGGVSFGWETFETRTPEIDGLKGPIKGATRITQAVPMISVNLVEWSLENFRLVFPGYEETTDGTGAERVSILTRSNRLFSEADYLDNIAIVGTLSGSEIPVVAMVKNALVTGGIELPLGPDSEATTEITFIGHYDGQNPEDEPWEIRYPNPDLT